MSAGFRAVCTCCDAVVVDLPGGPECSRGTFRTVCAPCLGGRTMTPLVGPQTFDLRESIGAREARGQRSPFKIVTPL